MTIAFEVLRNTTCCACPVASAIEENLEEQSGDFGFLGFRETHQVVVCLVAGATKGEA